METLYTTPSGAAFGGIGYTRRHVIAASSLLASATSVRVGFQHLLSTTYTITDAYIGLQAVSGDAYDIDTATLVRLTQGGNTTLTITNTAYYSDAVSLAVDGSRAAIVSLYGGTGQLYWAGALPSGYTAHYRSGNYAGVADVTSFSASPSNVVGFLTLEGELVSLFGPISIEEQVDDVSIASYTWNVGKIEISDELDEVSGQVVSDVCFVSINEEIDDVAATGGSAIVGIASIQEDPDTIVVSAYAPNAGQIAVSEELDAISGFAFETGLAIQGVIATEEYVDRVSIVGINQANRVLVDDAADEVAAVASTWNVGIVKVREYLDVVSAQMVRGESRGAVSITEAVDSVSAVATTSNVGKVLITCGLDNVDITSSTEQLNVGYINFTEPVDFVSSMAVVCIGATVNITDPNDEIIGAIASVNHGMISIQEELDIIKVNTKIIMPALEFSRPLSDVSIVTPAPPLGVMHFDRGSITSTSIVTAPSIEPINFTR